ncbi:MAG: 4'-phosphopantetheinyl transferase superfamily protein [Bacteroidota bacterium]
MPYITHNSSIPGVSIGVWQIEEDEWYFLSRIKLYENEWQRLSRISHPQKRLEWLSSRLCMKELLTIEDTTRVESLNSQNGKPFLTNNPHSISYTHSNCYSAAIASRNAEVGIDIEYRKRKRNLRTRFLFMNELELSVFDQTEAFELFLLIWSAKETIYKIHGQGVAFKDNIHLQLQNFTLKSNGSFNAIVHKEDLHKEYEVHYDISPDYILTYTCSGLPQQARGAFLEEAHPLRQ